jgi:oxygen-independent coproporphyrinogen-3 oxidase
VNRLSLGIQSFDESELCLLGRLHTRDEAITAYRMAREAGFDNVNLDLIFGLPNQPIAAWRTTLDWAIDLGPEHLSAYALTVEEGTPLAGQIARGELLNPDPDIAAEMYALAEEALAAAGYVHYEISNWARPGFECRHNLTYWYNHPYLGVGAGAHSWLAGRRWSNVLAPADYIARMVATWNSHPYAPVVAEVEEISAALEMGETMMLGLRLAEGVKFSQFRQRFGLEMQEVYNKEIRELRESGLVEVDSASVRLTARGWLLGNQVFARFLP